jgi:S-adenosylmethionine-dependent methyltransferase
MKDAKSQFDAGAHAWADYNRGLFGRIRRELTWHNLATHLLDATNLDASPRVLDAGGGSGELALRLAELGYRVWLVDYASAMLDQAQHAAQSLPDDARARLSFCHMPVEEVSQAFAAESFDAVICHTLIEYLPEPPNALQALSMLLRDGGLLSLSFVNRHAEVLRRVWSKADPSGALAGLDDGAFCATLFDLPGRAYSAEEVAAWLENLGLTVAATCGVRAFADFVPHEQLDDPDFVDALLRLEKAVADRPPYNSLARYVHLIAYKTADHESTN